MRGGKRMLIEKAAAKLVDDVRRAISMSRELQNAHELDYCETVIEALGTIVEECEMRRDELANEGDESDE